MSYKIAGFTVRGKAVYWTGKAWSDKNAEAKTYSNAERIRGDDLHTAQGTPYQGNVVSAVDFRPR